MSADWPEISIEELKASSRNAIAMGPFGSNIKAENFVEEGIPVIKGGNLTGDFIVEDKFDFLTEEKADQLKTSNAFRRDIVITHRGTIGQVGIIPDNSKFERYVVSQSQLKVTLDQEKVNPYFVYYFLRSPVGQHRLLMNASQVGVPAIAKASTSVKGIMVPCPEKEIQDKVVEIILGVDHKIHNNRQINQTLESMAQTIFKSWFVDFEPVKAKIAAIEAGEDAEGVTRAAMSAISGKTDDELDQLQAGQPDDYAQLKTTAELFSAAMQDSELGGVPEGWEVMPFSKLANLDTTSVKPNNESGKLWEHYSIPAFDVNEAPNLELGSEIKSNKYKVNPTAILSSKLNPNTPRTWWPDVNDETSAICSTEFMQFVPTDMVQRAFIFGLITSDIFQSGIKQRVTGSTGSRQRAQPRAVAEMDVIKPKEELVLAYCSRLTKLSVLKAKNIKENITLAKLRDTLLPKLLSGELEINAVNKAER